MQITSVNKLSKKNIIFHDAVVNQYGNNNDNGVIIIYCSEDDRDKIISHHPGHLELNTRVVWKFYDKYKKTSQRNDEDEDR